MDSDKVTDPQKENALAAHSVQLYNCIKIVGMKIVKKKQNKNMTQT